MPVDSTVRRRRSKDEIKKKKKGMFDTWELVPLWNIIN